MNISLGLNIVAFIFTLLALIGTGPAWLLPAAVMILCVSGIPWPARAA